jgi:glycosyltransferase involved in cell wall biosynthesis
MGGTMSDRRLIFVTQMIDPEDALLGTVPGMVAALAERFERVVVVANETRSVPDGLEVVSLGKEHGRGRCVRGAAYERALMSLLRSSRFDALLAHMCPVYLTAAAPLTTVAHVPRLLWYTHPRDSRTLRSAERLADVVLTALPATYPHESAKVRAIGHAVDVDRFMHVAPVARRVGPLRLLALGRTSDSKAYGVAVDGVGRARALGADVRLRIVGPATTAGERDERARLEARIRLSGLAGAVTIEPGVVASEVPRLLDEADALLSTTIDGSGDKAVFEAMAARRPAIVSNPAFADLVAGTPLGLTFPTGDAAALGERLGRLSAADAMAFVDTGTILHDRVSEGHSRGHWAGAVHDVVDELAGDER